MASQSGALPIRTTSRTRRSSKAYWSCLRTESRKRFSALGRVLLQFPLQRAPMHLQPTRRLADVAVAVGQDLVQVLPLVPVERGHLVDGRRRALAQQRGLDLVRVAGFVEVID